MPTPHLKVVSIQDHHRELGPDEDTVRRLEDLLTEARAGALTGVALIGLYRDQEHSVEVVGEARRHPIFVRGLLFDLREILK